MPTCSPAPISAKGKRDPFIDGIRGSLHIILLLDHLAILLPVLFGFWSAFFEPLGFFSFAEAYVFLSGYVSGLVYTRIYRERGKAALMRKAFARCGTIYSCYVISVVILLCFAKCLRQELSGWISWDQLSTLPLPVAACKVATLSCKPMFLEILPMYAMFLMFTPLIVLQLERKHHFAVIACSFLCWLAAQYAIGSGKGGLFFLNGAISTGYFSPLGWQTLFIIGLLCGHKTYDSNGPWLPRHPLCVLPVFCITIGLYMLRHSATGMSIGQEWAAGSTMGKGASVLAAFKRRKSEGESGNNPERCRNNLAVLVASLLVILLALASIWGTNAGRGFGYDGNARCSGPWDNPNIFGLLMGTGIALAVGLLLQSPMSKAKTQKVEVGKYIVVILCLLAGILMARGLLHSYSRGAWVATVCGLGYLVWRGGQALISKRQRHSCISQLNRNWLPFSIILASFFLLVFWHFRQTNWHPARRALSVVNTTDFSWRNRIVAWEGNLQIMAEHPWLGTGWNQPEPLYEHYYLPLKLNESAAIEMNDYLMLGATLGIPALCCFAIYLWLSLGKNSEVRSQNSELATLDWLQIICHAGAIVLLVGFWFDGGLFKLPTASIFWILLELGSCEKMPQRSGKANS